MGGTLVGAVLVVGVSAALIPFRSDVSRATPALVLVLAVVVAGVIGGWASALITAVSAALVFNLVFIPPFWTLEVDVLEDWVALMVFTSVAMTIGTLVAREASQRRTAEQRAAELQALYESYAAVQAERERLAEETTRLAILDQVDQQRTALLRSVSHDLRTPLSTIRAVTSDLRAGTEYDPDTRADLLDLVVDEAERLDRIVGNLLSLSRIEAGAFEPHPQAVPLDELVAECVRRLRRVLRDVRIEVNVPGDLPLANADYSQLDQVVTNLLENAARHSSQRSTIRVGAGQRDEMLAVWIEDEGPGVLVTDRQRIFQAFGRSVGSSTSGVGLSICKAIVEAHGGMIHVEDGLGGARFVFTLPIHHG